MKYPRLLLLLGLLISMPVRAVYAPVPDQSQGKAWTYELVTAYLHDSNIFAAPIDAIGSNVFSVAPKVAFNASVTDQTFLAASYRLTADYVDNRPGEKSLFNHDLSARLAHAFSDSTTIDVSDTFSVQRNPEALLNGLPVNSDQSYKTNEFDGSFTTALTAKIGLTSKVQSVIYSYDNARLGTSLDRTENLYGLSGDYAALADLKGVVEYRHQDVQYWSDSYDKNKSSDFALVGADYELAKVLTATARLGVEDRQREGQSNESLPYVELSGKYDYAKGSYATAGYVYTLEETSNVALYTDEVVNRLFVNVQHALTPLIAVSGSVDVEPSILRGVVGDPNVSETTTHLGFALSYLPTKNWLFSATFDYDNVDSGDKTRELNRSRVGASTRYTF